MNTRAYIAIIGVGVLISSGLIVVTFAARNRVDRPANELTVVDSSVCPVGGGQCGTDNNHQPLPQLLSANQGIDFDFTLEKIDGGAISLSEYRGQKPVIVVFWASWCPNCWRAMPKVNQWYQQYRSQIEIVGVNLQETQGAVQQFVESNGISFPIVLDPAGAVSTQFGIQFTNTHFLFSKSGDLIRVVPGDITESDILSLIES